MEVATISLIWAAITISFGGLTLAVTLALRDEKRLKARMVEYRINEPLACKIMDKTKNIGEESRRAQAYSRGPGRTRGLLKRQSPQRRGSAPAPQATA